MYIYIYLVCFVAYFAKGQSVEDRHGMKANQKQCNKSSHQSRNTGPTTNAPTLRNRFAALSSKCLLSRLRVQNPAR